MCYARINFEDTGNDACQEDFGYKRSKVAKGGTERIKWNTSGRENKKNKNRKIIKTIDLSWNYDKKQISETALSIAFIPLQGLEIFSSISGFFILDKK